MTIRQCDLCEVEITSQDSVMVGRLYRGVELCQACAQPVLDFLTERNLLEQADVSHLQTNEEAVS